MMGAAMPPGCQSGCVQSWRSFRLVIARRVRSGFWVELKALPPASAPWHHATRLITLQAQ